MKYLNLIQNSASMYIYGVIVSEKSKDWFTGEDSVYEIDTNDFLTELESLGKPKELNIYIDSPGGDVFTASTMVSLLKRFRQETGAVINTFVDGLCASAATYLLMVGDNIYIYQNSLVMVHKPMTFAWGNSDELQKAVDSLNVVQDDVMLPMYTAKALVDADMVNAMVNAETWFSGNPDSENYFGNYFACNYAEDGKGIAACSERMFKSFAHAPDALCIKNQPEQQITVDYSYYDNILQNLEATK